MRWVWGLAALTTVFVRRAEHFADHNMSAIAAMCAVAIIVMWIFDYGLYRKQNKSGQSDDQTDQDAPASGKYGNVKWWIEESALITLVHLAVIYSSLGSEYSLFYTLTCILCIAGMWIDGIVFGTGTSD